jgi:hypothetical protein
VALKRLGNGMFVVGNKKQAIEALVAMKNLQNEIEEFKKENGIDEMETDAVELKKAATAYFAQNNIDELDLPDGSYAKLISQGYDRRWLWTQEEASETEGAVGLRKVVFRKFKNKVQRAEIMERLTKRVVIPSAVDELVEEGLLDEDEIAASFVEKRKAPYLRIFGSRDG